MFTQITNVVAQNAFIEKVVVDDKYSVQINTCHVYSDKFFDYTSKTLKGQITKNDSKIIVLPSDVMCLNLLPSWSDRNTTI